MKTPIAVLSLYFMIESGASYGQAVSVGVKGGIPLSDATIQSSPIGNDESRPYVVGPSVEVSLPAGFAVEVSALYRRLGNTFGYGALYGSTNAFISRVRGNSWEFPVLGKYYFRRRSEKWQPFAGVGVAPRTAGFHYEGVQTIVNETGDPISFSFDMDSRSRTIGAVLAGGIRFRAGRFAILPEFRYTRWRSTAFGFDKNDSSLFLGITF